MKARNFFLALVLCASCFAPRPSDLPTARWEYLVDAPASGTNVLKVEATFTGTRTERLAIDEGAARHVEGLELKDGATWRPISRRDGAWVEPSCARHCTLRYRLDLGAVADGCDGRIDCAVRVGAATLSPAMAWLHPSPKLDVPVRVRFRAHGASFATGLRPLLGAPLTYSFRSTELDEGSFTAFGPMRRSQVEVARSSLDVIIVGDRRLAMSDADLRAWVGEGAAVVAGLYGHFPVARATVFVVPVRGENDVVFGKVLSLAGASVTVLVGEGMARASTHDDWVLVHELFHLGFPSFRGEGRWLGEGLATYYEPILRARAGWLSEAQLWTFFARELRRGVPRSGAEGLTASDDIDTIYWGGALFALLADVALRQASHSLDEVMRVTLARGGDATRVWTVADVMRIGDETSQTTVLADLYTRHAVRAEPIDLEALLASLGVETPPGEGGGVVTLRDDRPLAAVRRGISGKSQK